MLIRFRAEPDQANNLRVRVYTVDRSTLLATVTSGITQHVAGSGSYECEVGAITGTWYVLVNLVDTGETTSDGFASSVSPEVTDVIPVPVTVTVTPLTAAQRKIVEGTTMNLIVGSLDYVAMGVTDAYGASVDLTGRTLKLVFETQQRGDVAIVTNLTINGSTFAFTVPSAVVASERTLVWSLWDVGGDEVHLMRGLAPVVYAAMES